MHLPNPHHPVHHRPYSAQPSLPYRPEQSYSAQASLPYRPEQYPAQPSLPPYPPFNALQSHPGSLPYPPATQHLPPRSAQASLDYLLSSPMVESTARLTRPAHFSHPEGRFELGYGRKHRLAYPSPNSSLALPTSTPEYRTSTAHPRQRPSLAEQHPGPRLVGPATTPARDQPSLRIARDRRPSHQVLEMPNSRSSTPRPDVGNQPPPSPAVDDPTLVDPDDTLAEIGNRISDYAHNLGTLLADTPYYPPDVGDQDRPTATVDNLIELAANHNPPLHHVTWPTNHKVPLPSGPHRTQKRQTRCQAHDLILSQCESCYTGDGDLLYEQEIETLLLAKPIATHAYQPPTPSTSRTTPAPEDNDRFPPRPHSPHKRATLEEEDTLLPGHNQPLDCPASPESPKGSPERMHIDALGPDSPLEDNASDILDQSLEDRRDSMQTKPYLFYFE